MHINVDNFHELCEKHSELQLINNITAKHGEESEISQLCEVIAHLYAKIEALTPHTTSNVSVKKSTER